MSQHHLTTKLLGLALVGALALTLGCNRCGKTEQQQVPARLLGAPGAPPTDDEPTPTKPAVPAPAKKATPDDFGDYACRLMAGCYTKHSAFGKVSGRITVSVGADGKATAAAYDNGSAPAAVKDCIIAAGKQIHVTDFNAGAGDLVCDYDGQLLANGEASLTKTRKFIPKK